jgi:hypothetical protein
MSFVQAPKPPSAKQVADMSSLVLLQTMKTECITQFNAAWKNSDGSLKSRDEVQAFFDSYGDKAALAFELHAKLQELIYMADPSWEFLVPPYKYVKNSDGTVTIGE